ncbi:hypothetical protein [Candidatus Symbiopectobacterium sp. NZEC135]|uniref:hypothetical protein n=1 Tax=Candidatus Symbiopectobacterium sp. NZEC135 TaxID=2820471 RepID=UPI0022279725|nr:hypothetical protein [Candidatus Symbiopectobacterium sp. NZEC135]MCW2481381.1 hypothetical protein [Candidatus Symbiopectobacterium sp. NZEC135]
MIKLIFFCTMLLLTNSVYANSNQSSQSNNSSNTNNKPIVVLVPPPLQPIVQGTFLYRYDTVLPEDVFQIGFITSGNNNDMYQHIRGTSCYEGENNSMFLSTSSSLDIINIMAPAQTPVGSRYYIYTIRQTDQFYSSNQSLLQAYYMTGDRRFNDTYIHYNHENEWLSLGSIPAELVMYADEYENVGHDQEGRFIIRHNNINYIPGHSYINDSPYEMPFLPQDDAYSRTACSICDRHTHDHAFKRDAIASIRLWVKCRSHIIASVFFD